MTLREFRQIFYQSDANVHLIIVKKFADGGVGIKEIKCAVSNLVPERLSRECYGVTMDDIQLVSASCYLRSYDNVITNVVVASVSMKEDQ